MDLKEVTRLTIKKMKPRQRNSAVAPKLDSLLEKSSAIIITQYGGMTMPQLNKVRNQLRDVKAEFHITKNTLITRTLAAKGYSVPEKWLTGPTAVSFCFADAPAVAKILGDLSKEFDKLSVVGGVLSGKAIDANQVKDLANLPSMDTLRAQLIGMLTSPQSGIVGTLNAAVGSVMYALQARVDKEQPAEATA